MDVQLKLIKRTKQVVSDVEGGGEVDPPKAEKARLQSADK